MEGILSYDSWLGGLIIKIADYICLFFLWVFFSLPIITIGSSTCAFYYTFNKVLVKERGYIGRSFIKSFKDNFKQATGVFVLQIIVSIVLALDCYYMFLFKEMINDILSRVILVSIVIAYMWTVYWFPYISCFEDKTRTVLKNCGLIMLRNIHWSITILILFVLMLLLMYKYTAGVFVIPAVYMALNGLIFNRILRKYMPMEIEEPECAGEELIDDITEEGENNE